MPGIGPSATNVGSVGVDTRFLSRDNLLLQDLVYPVCAIMQVHTLLGAVDKASSSASVPKIRADSPPGAVLTRREGRKEGSGVSSCVGGIIRYQFPNKRRPAHQFQTAFAGRL